MNWGIKERRKTLIIPSIMTLDNYMGCPGESVQFSKNKTKTFDHYMDYYWNMNIEFYVSDKNISRKC